MAHLNTFRWIVPWDGMVRGGGKVELKSEGKGGWGCVSYRSFVP